MLTNLRYLRNANPLELVHWRDEPRLGGRTVNSQRFLWCSLQHHIEIDTYPANEFSIPNYRLTKGWTTGWAQCDYVMPYQSRESRD